MAFSSGRDQPNILGLYSEKGSEMGRHDQKAQELRDRVGDTEVHYCRNHWFSGNKPHLVIENEDGIYLQCKECGLRTALYEF